MLMENKRSKIAGKRENNTEIFSCCSLASRLTALDNTSKLFRQAVDVRIRLWSVREMELCYTVYWRAITVSVYVAFAGCNPTIILKSGETFKDAGRIIFKHKAKSST